ncbi:hypothetical protein DFH07DRAFT_810439 [Mycena maculata]|uniref:Uncharacterized protein n=1 Tax=Mycena maculata TaxID=230809 RepID=A0AAD7NLS0_9AGAR|nr:hypothetical protein DFH07DRAFT_810439 [Mycena maculata]
MPQSSPEGLVFVYLEGGADLAEDVLNDVYDNEHAPLRMTVPGFMTGVRYRAVDSKTPTWLTLYDIDKPQSANSDAYNALKDLVSDKEKAIWPKIAGLSRRSYAHIGTFTHPDTIAEALPSKYVLSVSLEVEPEGEDEFNRWYDEEHMDLLAKVPGWQRGRRFKSVQFDQRGVLADKPVFKYLAIHELDNNDFLQTPEFKHATSTEWRDRVMKHCVGRELRVFALHKNFGGKQ